MMDRFSINARTPDSFLESLDLVSVKVPRFFLDDFFNPER